MFSQNDFPNSTAHDFLCVLDRIAERFVRGSYLAHALTPADRANAIRSGLIKSVAAPLPAHITAITWTRAKPRNQSPEAFAAVAEILAINRKLKYGETCAIIKRHGAERNTVYRLLWDLRRNKEGAK
jgi:hypothetical protein